MQALIPPNNVYRNMLLPGGEGERIDSFKRNVAAMLSTFYFT